MRYKCQYPYCHYQTNSRGKIDSHHIIPRELGGSNDSSNKIWLCPNHHRNIHIAESISGIHSKIGDMDIQIVKKHYSTGGFLLEFIENGVTKFHNLHF